MAAWHAAKMMVPAKQGLIVNVSSAGGLRYLFNVAYGVGKAAVSTPPSLTTFPPPLPSLTPFPPPLPSLSPSPSPPFSYPFPSLPLHNIFVLLYCTLKVISMVSAGFSDFAKTLSHNSRIKYRRHVINRLRCSQPSYRNILISPRRTEWLQTWLWNYANRTWRVSLCGQELWKLRLWRTWFLAKRIKEERYSLIINAMF